MCRYLLLLYFVEGMWTIQKLMRENEKGVRLQVVFMKNILSTSVIHLSVDIRFWDINTMLHYITFCHFSNDFAWGIKTSFEQLRDRESSKYIQITP